MKNILVLTGSPRSNGNSEKLADAFIQGANSQGHQVTKYRTSGKNFKGCQYCYQCWSKGTACAIPDDFDELAPLLEKADVIVFASPLYWYSFSGQLKMAMDKLHAYTVPQCLKPLKVKETVLLTCGAEDHPDMFNGIIGSYQSAIRYMNIQDRGILAVPDVYDVGDIDKTDALQKAHALGARI